MGIPEPQTFGCCAHGNVCQGTAWIRQSIPRWKKCTDHSRDKQGPIPALPLVPAGAAFGIFGCSRCLLFVQTSRTHPDQEGRAWEVPGIDKDIIPTCCVFSLAIMGWQAAVLERVGLKSEPQARCSFQRDSGGCRSGASSWPGHCPRSWPPPPGHLSTANSLLKSTFTIV